MTYVIKVKDKDLFITIAAGQKWICEIPLIMDLEDANKVMDSLGVKICDFTEDNWYRKDDLEIKQITYQII